MSVTTAISISKSNNFPCLIKCSIWNGHFLQNTLWPSIKNITIKSNNTFNNIIVVLFCVAHESPENVYTLIVSVCNLIIIKKVIIELGYTMLMLIQFFSNIYWPFQIMYNCTFPRWFAIKVAKRKKTYT